MYPCFVRLHTFLYAQNMNINMLKHIPARLESTEHVEPKLTDKLCASLQQEHSCCSKIINSVQFERADG